jgi:hypothetical protein
MGKEDLFIIPRVADTVVQSNDWLGGFLVLIERDLRPA